jgi:hypothetical protein
LFFELGAEVAPFVGEAVEVAGPFLSFLMEGVPAGVVLIGSGVGKFDISSFDLEFK